MRPGGEVIGGLEKHRVIVDVIREDTEQCACRWGLLRLHGQEKPAPMYQSIQHHTLDQLSSLFFSHTPRTFAVR